MLGICTTQARCTSKYFMPRRQDATDRPDSAACNSSTASPPASTMWEYHQAHAALQPSPSWSPYAGTTASLLDGSDFTADSAAATDLRLPAGEHVHGHAWSQGQLSNSARYRENFLDLLASKNVTPEMFEDVPGAGHYVAPATLTARLEAAGSAVSPMKYEIAGSPLFLGSSTNSALQAQGMNMMSCIPRYVVDDHHQMKAAGSNHQQQEDANPMASFLQQISTRTSAGMHTSLDYSGLGGLDKICQEGRATEASPFSMRSLPDFGSFGGYRSTIETTAAQLYMRCADLSDGSRQEQEIMSQARSSSSGSGAAASGRKKRPSEERQESTVKKSKQEASTASPPKQQVPKVKLSEKITELQQIVSPFGKTDTASVLFETIKYIKFLHEQVQLLSEPYTDASRNKGSNNVPWGGNAEASKGEGEHDLRDRGLCLVPVSWTPEVYRDGNAMDYWTPAYRGCLYR